MPLWSRDARRELWANLGAMVLWLIVAFGGYIAIRSSSVWHWIPLPLCRTGCLSSPPSAAVLVTSAHLVLAPRARRNELNERHGLKIWLLAAISFAAYFYSPSCSA